MAIGQTTRPRHFKYRIVLEKSRAEEERKVEELKQKLEAAIAARQEAEARAAHLEQKLNASPNAASGVTHGNIAAIAKVIRSLVAQWRVYTPLRAL